MYRGDDYYDGLIKREEEIINKLKHKIEQHTVLEEDKTKIDNGIIKIKEAINTKEIMQNLIRKYLKLL